MHRRQRAQDDSGLASGPWRGQRAVTAFLAPLRQGSRPAPACETRPAGRRSRPGREGGEPCPGDGLGSRTRGRSPEAAAKKRRSGVSDGDEKALVESILGDGVAPIEKKEPPDPELERLRTEADALRAAAARLKGHLPRRREGVPALRSIMSFWIPIAHSTAATTEGNSISSPSPVVFDDVAALARDERSRRRAMLAHHPRRPHP